MPRLKRLVESLESGRGNAYAVDESSSIFVENNAVARVIDRDMYGTNERLANQFMPTTMTGDGLLPRWEKIFGITPSPTDTDVVRRARVQAKWASFPVLNNYQAVFDALTAVLSPMFFSILHRDPPQAVQYWANGVTQFPAGTNGVQLPAPSWGTNGMHAMVFLTKPVGYTEAQFYAAAALIGPILDPMLPAYETWAWARVDSGTGLAGFHLDSVHNLDNDMFAT